MKDGFVKVRCASFNTISGDIKGNCEKLKTLINETERLGAKILVTSELGLCGYSSYDLIGHTAILNECKRAIEDIRQSTAGKDVLALVGAPLARDGQVYNCAIAIKGGEILGAVPKINLTNEEKRVFSTPCEAKTVRIGSCEVEINPNLVFECTTVDNLTVGVEIGEDIYTKEVKSSVVCNLSAINEIVGREEKRRILIKGKSLASSCAYLYCEAPESETSMDIIYSAHNIVYENGDLIAESKPFEKENGDTVCEIDVNKLANVSRHSPTSLGSGDLVEFKLKSVRTELTRKVNPHPFRVKESECEKILEIQARALAKRIVSSYSKKMVIGISGGLDSTIALLVMVRCADILEWEREQIVAVTMPCFGTTSRTKSNAITLCEEYGVDLREIDISEAVRGHLNDIDHDEANHNVTYENAQARERTQVLMDIANDENALVVGTGDLSEIALGWCTYNADHMSMYNVNSTLSKTLIRQMLSYFAKATYNVVEKQVIYDILDTPVSPELLPADADGNITQKTEESVGSYDLNDFFLYNMIYMGFTPSKTYRLACIAFEKKIENEEIYESLERFIKRFFSQQFKRSCSPDGIQIGAVSLSPRGAFKMASDMSAKSYLEELNNNI